MLVRPLLTGLGLSLQCAPQPSSGAPPDPPPPAIRVPDGHVNESARPPGPAPVGGPIVMLDAGEPPRIPLRIHPHRGSTQTLRVQQHQVVPAYHGITWDETYRLRVEVDRHLDPEPCRYAFVIVAGQAHDASDKRPGAVGTRGTTTFGPRGRTAPIVWTETGDFDSGWARPTVANALERTIVPLPLEPVGVGATWRVDETEDPKWSTTYRLTARTDEGFTLEGHAEPTVEIYYEGKGGSGYYRPPPAELEVHWRVDEPVPYRSRWTPLNPPDASRTFHEYSIESVDDPG